LPLRRTRLCRGRSDWRTDWRTSHKDPAKSACSCRSRQSRGVARPPDLEVNGGNSGGRVYAVETGRVVGVCVAARNAYVSYADGSSPVETPRGRTIYSSGLTVVSPPGTSAVCSGTTSLHGQDQMRLGPNAKLPRRALRAVGPTPPPADRRADQAGTRPSRRRGPRPQVRVRTPGSARQYLSRNKRRARRLNSSNGSATANAWASRSLRTS
jgi:hypothetical protein